jgi:hypothetical protein
VGVSNVVFRPVGQGPESSPRRLLAEGKWKGRQGRINPALILPAPGGLAVFASPSPERASITMEKQFLWVSLIVFASVGVSNVVLMLLRLCCVAVGFLVGVADFIGCFF